MSALVIKKSLLNLGARIHDERSVLNHRLADRAAL
jgi:hypothetical protein